MSKFSFLAVAAAIGAMGLAAAPALAATPTASAGFDNVPMCSTSDTVRINLDNGVDAQLLRQDGKTLSSLDTWNGCLKAVYTDNSGHTTMAFYDPDTLKLIATDAAQS